MEWVYIILNAVLFFLVGLFIKNYLPSYIDEKGKNLATKEDIEFITRKTEAVQKEFKEGFELFSSDVRFKYDFNCKQYSKLYSKLYGIIIQSEYARQFTKLYDGTEISFNDAPFLEITSTHRVTQSIEWENGKPGRFKQEEENIITPISEFNKNHLCEYIIENAEYATQRLLKIAVSYRFAYHFYSGNPDCKNSSCSDAANEEEFRLIRDMVCCIVSEYNHLRKELKMEYNEDELNTGIPQI